MQYVNSREPGEFGDGVTVGVENPVVVFTGALASMSYADAKLKAEVMGWTVHDIVDDTTTLLVLGFCGSEAKVKAANERGIEVIGEAEFLSRIIEHKVGGDYVNIGAASSVESDVSTLSQFPLGSKWVWRGRKRVPLYYTVGHTYEVIGHGEGVVYLTDNRGRASNLGSGHIWYEHDFLEWFDPASSEDGSAPAESHAAPDRILELLEANNALLERARAAEEGLFLMREFAIRNATQWNLGSGHHHPIWEHVAEILHENWHTVDINDACRYAFIHPENEETLEALRRMTEDSRADNDLMDEIAVVDACTHPSVVPQNLGDGTPIEFCPDCGTNRIVGPSAPEPYCTICKTEPCTCANELRW